ncbi:DMT family transporter [Rhizobium sp. CB3171]|uniref:DMT family transporter n=1 Tax=unclassified Rhizobium TaxID=2613769 RepID=UPI000CDF3F41|nr:MULTISPECIES: DMT family transporter [Rhizobium]AVA21822.1 DMT superfamily inner membrane transporter protein [Rhizobium sp. NXC24]MDK4737748.1 DMT family transporter [Rhizobium sp. CNPSo 3464]UWU22875.1 DMT family transporter [Rhizobium tropici]WFU03662.1 DMT family transporter [Rhizobium sp. CB3171]
MPRTKNTQGALYMAAAMAGFSCSDALSKSVIAVMNAGEIMFLRGLFTSIFVFLLAWNMGALRSWKVILQPMIALRVVCEGIAAATYITALGMMPIANASAILQALPLAVTLGAALFLKEPVGWRRWTAIVVGFVGVLIIIRPGPDGFTTAALLVVASMFATAARDLATRCVSKDVPSLMVTVCTAVSISIFGALSIAPLGGWQPITFTPFSHILLASILVLVGYQSVIQAMRTGEISFVAPFRYLSLIWSALLGLLFFSEMPDAWTMIGSAIVIASGLYTFYRESKRQAVERVAQESEPRVPA